jgi:S-adenosylmethionine:diacylglycerol 3-amino-3-carboxypropyl transferase
LELKVPENIMAHWAYESVEAAKGLKADRSSIYGGFHVYEKLAQPVRKDLAA